MSDYFDKIPHGCKENPVAAKAFYDYFGLPANELAPKPVLEGLYYDLQPVGTRAIRSIVGSIALELSQQPAINDTQRSLYLRRAFAAWLENTRVHADSSEVFGSGLHLAAWPQYHAPQLPTRAGEAFTRGVLNEQGRRLQIAYQQAQKPRQRNYILGFMNEWAVFTLLGTGAVAGVQVRPSLERQNSNHSHIDDKVYRWDLTLDSDGSELPAGEYRLQVKTNPTPEDVREYHRDIIVIKATKHMFETHYHHRRIGSRALHVCLLPSEQHTFAQKHRVRTIQNSLLAALESHGPAILSPHTGADSKT